MNFLATKKLLNIFLVNASRLLGLERALGRPFGMVLDPSTACNLKCPLCIQGMQKGVFEEKLFPFPLYEKTLAHFGPWLTSLGLYSWGEPFLNKRIYEMIEMAKGYDIEVTISTNLNVGDARKIVESGLDQLVCSLDGATQEIYEKYRIGGDLGAALDRAREIIRIKKELGVSKPRLVWQYLLFEHNKREVEAAEALANEMGFDCFYSMPGFVHVEHPVIKPVDGVIRTGIRPTPPDPSEQAPPAAVARRRFLNTKEEGCAWLYSHVTIDPTGNYFPCCFFWMDSHSFGKVDENNIASIHNSVNFRRVREYFDARRKGGKAVLDKIYVDGQPPETHPCEICGRFNETAVSYEALRDYFEPRLRLPKPILKLLKESMK